MINQHLINTRKNSKVLYLIQLSFIIIMLSFFSNLQGLTIINVSTAQQMTDAISSLDTLNDSSVKIMVTSSINHATTYSINFDNFSTVKDLAITAASNSITLQNNSNNNMFNITGSFYNEDKPSFKLSNLTLYSNNSNPSSVVTAIYFSNNFNNIEISYCNFNNYMNSIRFPDGPNSFHVVEQLKITDNNANGINASQCSYRFFSGKGSYKTFNFLNNHIYRHQYQILSPLSNTDDYLIENNHFIVNHQTNNNFCGTLDFEFSNPSNNNTNLKILNNVLQNCNINLDDTSFLIESNKFINNSLYGYSIITRYTSSSGYTNKINNNIFWGNSQTSIAEFSLWVDNVNVDINKNSFLTCSNLLIFGFYNTQNIYNPINEFKNNLLNNTANACIVNNQGQSINFDPNDKIIADHCFFTSNISNNSFSIPNIGTENFIGNPLITLNPTLNTYTLNWTNTQKSPLIMNGYYSELIGQTNDSSWDRDDIGAIQYSGDPHSTRKYVLPPATQNSGIKWMSFPVVENLYNPSSNDPDYANNFFSPILYTSQIEYIKSKYQNQNEKTIINNGQGWLNTNYTLTPIIGHKIKVNSNYNQYQSFLKSAHKPNVNTVIPLFALKQGSLESNENWIGYFCETTKSVQDAFGSFFTNSSIYYIQHQNWTAHRKNSLSPWTIAVPMGQSATLKYGDMVIIKCSSDISNFTWGASGQQREEYVREQTTNYLYEEEADYIPIYASFSTEEMPSEIAVFIDDECKGAAVVNSNLVEIPAYIVDDIENNPELEIRMYYDSKNAVTIPNTAFFNEDTQTYTSKLKVTEKKDCFNVRIGKDTPLVDPEFSIRLSNYPNPFNPSTTLNYQIAESGDIKMTIYNVKGQLVKSIYNGYQEKGTYQMVWDGKDDNNTNVASGIYYASLKTNKHIIVKKMILMK